MSSGCKISCVLGALFLGALLPRTAASNQIRAAEKVTYAIPRVTSAPRIDGRMDGDEWQAASQVSLRYDISPGDNDPAPVKTTAYIMEDGEQLYVAIVAEDPEPEKIRAFLRDRDGIFQDDFVGIIIDTFNDERRGFEFFVNPLGVQGDLTRDDTQFREDSSWDTTWDSAGEVNGDGFLVEMAIPFRALRYTADLAEQTWGVQFLRIYPRDSRAVFSDSPSDRDLNCTLCQVHKMKGMPNLQVTGQNLDITPTLTYVNNETRDVVAAGDWQRATDEADLGVDLRWAMSEDWILNATLNPDFSQVEADAGQLDINTTFSLFFPESRPFFLDGADYFSTMNRLVHTRNIADPDLGVKVTGKTKGTSAGLIIATDEQTSFLLPGNQGSDFASLEDVASEILIGRAQMDIGEKNNLGVLLTHRSGDDYRNRMLAFDGTYYFSKENRLRFQLMRSDSENPDSVQSDFDVARKQADNALTLNFSRDTEAYSLWGNYQDFGTDFRADMGFVSKVDYKKMALGGSYRWYGKKDSKWTRWGFFGDWDRTTDQAGKELEEEYELHFDLRGPMQFMTNLGGGRRNEYFNGENFDVDFQMMWFEVKPSSSFTFGNFMRFGDQIDFANTQLGKIRLFEPYINWQLGIHFNARVSYTEQTLKVAGGELFNARLSDIRLAYQFSIRSRLSLTIQTTDIRRNVALFDANNDSDADNDVARTFKTLGTQLIYSYKINPQSLFFLGYSDNAFENDELTSLQKSDRTFFAKVSYQWQG